eukprot:764849-Hanusia_phi.AAC.1
MLLKHGNPTSDWWKEDPTASTFLKFACERFNDYFVERLFYHLKRLGNLDFSGMVNYGDHSGGSHKNYTPLYWLFRKRTPSSNEVSSARMIANLLVEHGADPSLPVHKNQTTILALAQRNGYLNEEQADLLNRKACKSAKRNKRTSEGQQQSSKVLLLRAGRVPALVLAPVGACSN